MDSLRHSAQALIIGSGLAGCTAALNLADAGQDVLLLTNESELLSGNSVLAQGGIVYKAEGEQPSQLEKDVLGCGWKHNYAPAVRHLAVNGPKVVELELIERLRVAFDQKPDGSWHLTKEGGHSLARILHCTDHTGLEIMREMTKAVAAHPGIRVLTGRTVIDLLTSHHHPNSLQYKYHLTNQCLGAYVFNEQYKLVETIFADYTILATGGAGQIYLHTTNSRSAMGSALALAYRAGARYFNVEYIQFHPTALYHRAERRFLITEAMRGEGGRLLNAKGEQFMKKLDPRGELAPRDIVTRGILDEMMRTGEPCVYLDASQSVPDLARRFPMIYEKCLELGIDITQKPIPVVPAAHYSCGGVLTDNAGRTTLERLYAAGECACTGLHGANRLASTSLLECLVWGYSAAQDIIKRQRGKKTGLSDRLKASVPDWVDTGSQRNDDPALIAQDWATIKNTMWNYVGILRSGARLKRAFEDLRDLNKHLHDFYRDTPISRPVIELFHGCQAAYIITLAAMRNKESLGCHYRAD